MTSTKINVLFYYHFYKSLTGGPRTLLSVLENLDRSRFHPHFATQQASPLLDAITALGVSSTVIPAPNSIAAQDGALLRGGVFKKGRSFKGLLSYNRMVGKLLDANNIDVVWSRGIKAVLMTGWAARRKGVPQIWDIALEKPSRGMIGRLHRVGFFLSDLAITEAECQKSQIFGEKMADRQKHKLIHLESAIPKSMIDALETATANRGGTANMLRVLTVGSVGERKNQQMLIHAARLLRSQDVLVELHIVGPFENDEIKNQLEQLVTENSLEDQVFFHGWQDNTAEYYANADVFALCSRNEGVPHVIKEAMFAKLPVIATPVGGVPDVIQDGTNGFIVEVDDLEGLVEKIALLNRQSELRKVLGTNGQKFAQQRFVPTTECLEYQKIFTRLVAARQTGK